ncbi:RNA polymerase sigma factor [Streptomyces sp. NPDC092369]|uniref:RNA polymerase sigma factor n=1 Tax=Streptomyces sp. NPDC092369 TaxID=3366015 RepID=UPI0037FBCCE6
MSSSPEPADGIDHSATAPAPPDQPDVQQLLRQAKDAQFSAFYQTTVGRLVGFLVNQGAGVEVAADIAQDTMTAAYRSWDDIREPRAWVHTVASRSLVRRIASTSEQSVEQVPEPTSLLACPDDVAEFETRHDLLPLLRRLPPRQRQILAWTLADFTPAEVAGELDLTDEAVRASLYKARRTIAAALKEREGEQ